MHHLLYLAKNIGDKRVSCLTCGEVLLNNLSLLLRSESLNTILDIGKMAKNYKNIDNI